MTERIGFIGLGLMGRPMTHHLLAAGYRLTVFNRSRPAIDELVSAGVDTQSTALSVVTFLSASSRTFIATASFAFAVFTPACASDNFVSSPSEVT